MNSFQAGDLAWISILTVAGQRRTCTGFAFKPTHPGVKAPEKHYSIDVILAMKWDGVKRKKQLSLAILLEQGDDARGAIDPDTLSGFEP